MPLATRHEVGQLLFGSLPGPTMTAEWRALAREFDCGGITLFARNVEAPAQVAELAHDISLLGRTTPAWVSVDQEGGRVARLKAPFTLWPPAAVLGRAGSEDLAERFAAALARELAAVGVTLDFAPVLDIRSRADNPAIGDRALAERAADVARLGRAVIRGLQANGLAACGKHFPGHGDTSVDSHLDLPLVEHPPDRLRAVEFEPFRAAIVEGVACLMTAHLHVPALDEGRPCTLSRAVVQGLLRDELGFDGAILTDDLEMKAVSARWPVPQAAVEAVKAGCDGVLVCSGGHDVQAAVLEALVRAVESGEIPQTRFDAATRRMRATKQRFLSGGVAKPRTPKAIAAVVGCEAHQRIAAEMAAFL